jgi:hypothetical protein
MKTIAAIVLLSCAFGQDKANSSVILRTCFRDRESRLY